MLIINLFFILMRNLVSAIFFRVFVNRVEFTATAESPTIIIISFVEWQGAFQRPQHLAQQLALMGFKVYYFSLLRVHRALQSPEWLAFHKGKSETPNLRVITPVSFPLDARFSFFRAINNEILLLFIRRFCRSGGRPYVIVNAPFFNSVVFRMDYQRLLYDIMDELTAGRGGERLKADENELIKRADVLSSGTMAVAELKKKIRPDITFISCGVDYEHFSRAMSESITIPEDIARIPHPIVGYFGAVNERVDYLLLSELAKQLPHTNFVFIGPISVNISSLLTHRNVFFLGWRAYQELPAYLKAFDVAIVPYRLSEGVEYVNPVKVLEYLAGGKPVVSTAIADVERFYSDVVFIARDVSEFASIIQQLIANPEMAKQRIERGKQVAQLRSWRAMAEEFAVLLKLS
ncbi:glycosyltransferase [Candidatus Sumerlaeota bacterium]|nr:glycosyltransferase [Candidatus Sumerlaeota bacterium]